MKKSTCDAKREISSLLIIFLISLIFYLWQAHPLSAADKTVSTPLRDGVYEGKSFKFPGPMTVSVKVAEGKIAEIKVVRQYGLKKYTDILKSLIDRIIQKQSTQVDGVTHATISSNALKKAVEDALKKAQSPPNNT